MIRTTSVVLAASALLALPAASDAATTFGSRLNHDPANSGECKDLPTPCTLASYIHPSDPNGDPYAGGAPADGVITKFRIRAYGIDAAANVTFRLARVNRQDPQNDDSALATAAGTGPSATVPVYNPGDDTPVTEVPGSLRVKKGDYLAIDGTNVAATYNSSGDKYTYRYDPPLVDGQGPRASNEATGELLVQAVIEPDADNDGLGDETQDPAIGNNNGNGNGGNGQADRTKPRVSRLKLSGGALTYRLSERAKVTLRVKKGGRTVKKITRRGKAGQNRIKIGVRKLAEGRYKLVLSARDTAGNASAVKRIGLRVKS
jgi:hypothetical protein